MVGLLPEAVEVRNHSESTLWERLVMEAYRGRFPPNWVLVEQDARELWRIIRDVGPPGPEATFTLDQIDRALLYALGQRLRPEHREAVEFFLKEDARR